MIKYPTSCLWSHLNVLFKVKCLCLKCLKSSAKGGAITKSITFELFSPILNMVLLRCALDY